MCFKSKLAIIIPAYKINFFGQAIQSIANQTCRDFTLYIGDDASPDDFNRIVDNYKQQINIVFKRFELNLGYKDLVSHWNRCVDMIQDEEWIWFFSDDDLMDDNCVELFYKHIEENAHHNLLHFNINVINEDNIKIYKAEKFQPFLSSTDFFKKRLNGELKSCAVEYIFNRQVFEKVNGFESFDLAWASDDATWLKISADGGINTIGGAFVRWRQSTLNISPRLDNTTVARKVAATINYINWAKDFFFTNNICDNSTDIEKAKYSISTIIYTSSINYREKYRLVDGVIENLSLNKIRFRVILLWLFLEFKERTKYLIRYNELLIRMQEN